MARKILTHDELDILLDDLASDLDGFEEHAEELAAKLDRQNTDLQIMDSSEWRKPASEGAPRPKSGFVEQFRADVESVEIHDRPTEARLARRIEFARVRLRLAQQAAGMDEAEVLGGIGQLASTWMQSPAKSRRMPTDKVMVRAAELHALRTEMVERNLYLALINVERYAHSSTNRADLIQEGSAALFRAVDGFDWRRGLLFRTYAVHWLNQAFRNYLYNFSNTVRVPVYLQKAMKQIHQAQIRLGDPNASAEQIAEQTDLTESLVSSALSAARSSYSLDADLGSDGDGNRLRDLLQEEVDEDGPYSTRLEDVSLEGGLARALESLSDRERLVVTMRFGIGAQVEHTLAQVAKHLGVSVERVRQIQVRAISKLNTPGLRRELDPFLN